eukprot:TRINITY_DN24688_c0_g1_i1.p1 TRINITY_DN24688_c0_g1~~TRINITY_DN24688_c0_g1_i1.p1  ORF type:complete len:859 (-),score=189.44 TRINITY_DN24688_c0_g1_i1:280-2763(-)
MSGAAASKAATLSAAASKATAGQAEAETASPAEAGGHVAAGHARQVQAAADTKPEAAGAEHERTTSAKADKRVDDASTKVGLEAAKLETAACQAETTAADVSPPPVATLTDSEVPLSHPVGGATDSAAAGYPTAESAPPSCGTVLLGSKDENCQTLGVHACFPPQSESTQSGQPAEVAQAAATAAVPPPPTSTAGILSDWELVPSVAAATTSVSPEKAQTAADATDPVTEGGPLLPVSALSSLTSVESNAAGAGRSPAGTDEQVAVGSGLTGESAASAVPAVAGGPPPTASMASAHSSAVLDAPVGGGPPPTASIASAQSTQALPVEEPLEVGSEPRLRPRGDFMWVLKENDFTDRALRQEAAEETVKACKWGYYVRERKQVSLNRIQDMQSGTEIIQAPACLPTPSVSSRGPCKPRRPTRMERHRPGLLMPVALERAQAGRKVAAVSAASAYNMGGGFLKGGRHALEESICMQTTLMRSLEAAKMEAEIRGISPPTSAVPAFQPNGRPWHCHIPEDGVILSPCVEVFRGGSLEGYPFWDTPVELSAIVSVAAYNCNPRVRDAPVDKPNDKTQYFLHLCRKFFATCQAAKKAQADVLVMPDVGCGVYGNDASVVGEAFAAALQLSRADFAEVHLVGSPAFADAVEAAAANPYTCAKTQQLASQCDMRGDGYRKSPSRQFRTQGADEEPRLLDDIRSGMAQGMEAASAAATAAIGAAKESLMDAVFGDQDVSTPTSTGQSGLGPRTATSSTSSSRHHHHPGPYRAQRPAAAPANADAESDRRIAAALAAGQQAGRPISTTMRRPEKPADGRSAADSPPHPTIVSEPDK